MKAHVEKEKAKEVAAEGAFRRPSSGHRARQRIATPGDMTGGSARSGTGPIRRTPKRFGM